MAGLACFQPIVARESHQAVQISAECPEPNLQLRNKIVSDNSINKGCETDINFAYSTTSFYTVKIHGCLHSWCYIIIIMRSVLNTGKLLLVQTRIYFLAKYRWKMSNCYDVMSSSSWIIYIRWQWRNFFISLYASCCGWHDVGQKM